MHNIGVRAATVATNVATKAQATKVEHLVKRFVEAAVVATSVATRAQATRVEYLVSASLRLVFDL